MNHKLTSVILLLPLLGCELTAKDLTDAALVLATIGLVLATIKLAQYTNALSALTQRLVTIEIGRDEKDAADKRRADLVLGLQAAEIVQRIYSDNFAHSLNTTTLPIADMNAIETLQSLKRYIDDTETHPNLDYLCTVFDSVRREKTQVRQNEEDIQRRVKTLQGRIQWFVDSARRELSSVKS